jgi:[protein-PII] uridylyltransferase
MFLLDGNAIKGGKTHPGLALIGEGILTDCGLKVGHSTRTLADCVHVANTDVKSKTSLIEARLVSGDAALFSRFQLLLKERCVKGQEADYIAARLADQEGRHAKYGNSPMMQEPNIKNGCGGLRDYQNLLWMTYFKHGARTTEELAAKEMISQAEANDLEAAYDFLLRARTELHYQVTRPLDVLNKNLQPTVAHYLGYKDRSPWVRLENFMRDYYTHSRHIYLITRTVEKRLALAPPRRKLLPALTRFLGRKSPATPVDGFKFADGKVAAATSRIFDDSPRRLMRAFLHAQQRGLELHPDLVQLMRHKLTLVNRAFRHDPHVQTTFLEILNHRGNVGAILRAMHEVGLLGKYLPEFGKLTNLVQHEFYHQYAADEHTLVCLEKLDQVWQGKTEPYSNYTELLHSLEKPALLNLCLLLHDAGKASDFADHAAASSRSASQAAQRLGLDAASTGTICHLIQHHLTMAQIAQRRDLGDPAVIRHFAAVVQSEQNLKLLTLLTFADTMGTSEKLWNGFKDTLLRMLYHKTLDVLDGAKDFARNEETSRNLMALELARQMPKHLSEEELHAHFKHLPSRYFQIHNSLDILADLELTHEFIAALAGRELTNELAALHPVVAWRNDPDRSCSEVKICTWDRPRLFSRIAGACSAAGLNILSAQIFTRADGIALDTFYVTDVLTGSVVSREQREQWEIILKRVLEKPDTDLHPLIARQNVGHSLYQSLEGEHLPTKIQFDNSSSADRTLVEITTEDRVGLLYVISQALAELGLDISLAKISTEKGAAIDTFYVTHCYEGKITSPALQDKIRTKLMGVIFSLERSVTTR